MKETNIEKYEYLKKSIFNMSSKLIIVDHNDPLYLDINEVLLEQIGINSIKSLQNKLNNETGMNFIVSVINNDITAPGKSVDQISTFRSSAVN